MPCHFLYKWKDDCVQCHKGKSRLTLLGRVNVTQLFTAARVKIRERQNNGLSIACKQAVHLGIARSEGSHTNFKGSEVHGQPLHVTYDSLPHEFASAWAHPRPQILRLFEPVVVQSAKDALLHNRTLAKRPIGIQDSKENII